MADGERSPLLPPEAGPGPGGAASTGETEGVVLPEWAWLSAIRGMCFFFYDPAVPPLAGGGGAVPGEAPPPYSPLGSPEAVGAGPPAVTCRVCQRPISVEGKTHQHVVKCGGCGEATVRGGA